MQVLLDNLTATIISGILILGLQVTQVRSQHSSIEQVVSHSVKAKTHVFGQWLEHDILDLGANYGTNLYRFEEPVLDAFGNTTEWTFYSNGTDPLSGAPIRILKRYRLEPTKEVVFSEGTAQEETFQLYRLDRDSLVVGFDAGGNLESYTEGDWVPSGESVSTLSFFQIDLLGRDGQTPCLDGTVVTNADGDVISCTGEIDVYKADYVRVRFGVVPEYVLKPDNYIRELYWAKTLKIRPYWDRPESLKPKSAPVAS